MEHSGVFLKNQNFFQTFKTASAFKTTKISMKNDGHSRMHINNAKSMTLLRLIVRTPKILIVQLMFHVHSLFN